METKNISTSKNIATQSNDLINSRYQLDEMQQKLILLTIAQIDSLNDKKFFKYNCTVKELEQKLNVKINYKQFRESCIDLFKKPIYIPKGKGWLTMNWFSSIEYFENEGRVEFEISSKLQPYLLQLKNNFTSCNLVEIVKFTSKYAIRFYAFLMQMKNLEEKKRIFILEDLYEILQLPKTMRIWGQFERNVLKVSFNEINKFSDIKATYETKKTGRKITHLVLKFSMKKAKQTKAATEAKAAKTAYKDLIGKFVRFDKDIYKIEKIRNGENGLEVIYLDGKDYFRLDFKDINELKINITETEIFLKENDGGDGRRDRSEHVVNMLESLLKKY